MSGGCFAALACNAMKTSSLSAMFDAWAREATDAFDHILLGASNLEAGIQWVEEHTGVRAEFGGNHPGRGTRNALLSLGTGHYLEIIAPDPAQTNAPDERGLKQLSSPRIIQWAVYTEDIAAAKRVADAAGVKTIGPQAGSRARPDGKVLRWQMLGIEQTTPLVPFLIQWDPGSPHPSSDSPPLGKARSLSFETSQPDELRRILNGVGVQAEIRKSNLSRIVLVVQTPSGAIEIS